MEEKIRQKLNELAEQKLQIMAQFNAVAGAEQALLQLLKDDETEEESQNAKT